MRSVSMRACGAALLLLLILFPAVPAFADDPPGTVVEGRIHIPGGLTAEDEEPPTVLELFLVWLAHRIHIPGG